MSAALAYIRRYRASLTERKARRLAREFREFQAERLAMWPDPVLHARTQTENAFALAAAAGRIPAMADGQLTPEEV